MTESNTQVLIVGAGPTGLTLACDLARRGIAYRIIDMSPAFFVGSRGKGLQPRSLEVFDDLGVIHRILSAGRFHVPFRAYDGYTVLGDKDPHEGRVPTPAVPYASVLITPQWKVEETLRGRLADFGGHVELGMKLVDLSQDTLGVTASIERNGAVGTVRAKYLVGCDGGHSPVRHLLGLTFEGDTYESQRMLVGDVEATLLDRDHWHAWPGHPDGAVTLCPLPGTNQFQFQAVLKTAEPVEPTLEKFQEVFDGRTGRSDIRMSNPGWLSLYRANVRMVNQYRSGRVFIAGDAAHVHSPAGGQGMNTGIQDAYNLGWKLGQVLAGAPQELLDSYENERLPIARGILAMTSKLHAKYFSEASDADVRRDPEGLQLSLHYRAGALSVDDGVGLDSLRAGDRAPDAPFQDANDGSIGRLFDLFRGPHFTLLAFNAKKPDGLPGMVHDYSIGEDLLDTAGHIRNAYPIPQGAYVLIRPDGYIASITHTVDELEGVLNRMIAPGLSGLR